MIHPNPPRSASCCRLRCRHLQLQPVQPSPGVLDEGEGPQDSHHRPPHLHLGRQVRYLSTYNMLISRKKITVVNETVRKLFNAELKCKKLILILNISHKAEAK